MTKKEDLLYKEGIVDGLKSLGLKEGDVVVVHSSLRSLGWVEGGANTVIDAFLEVVGAKGTVVVPTPPFNGWMYDYIANNPIFDVKRTPSTAGIITEALRTRKEALRSLEPSGSIAAIGAMAVFITRDDESDDPCGQNSPWGKLVELNSHIIFIGVNFNSCEMMHYVESLARVPYSLTEEKYPYRVMDAKGKMSTRWVRSHRRGVPRDYTKIELLLLEKGVLKMGRIGKATTRLIRAQDLIDTVIPILKEDPTFLLTDKNWRWSN